jgi:hypothetical protein
LEASSLVAVLLEAFQVEDHVLMEEACQGACLEGGCLEGSQEEEDQEEVLLHKKGVIRLGGIQCV